MSRLYGSVNIDVDVDLSDIYDNMSRSQKTEFADKLQDEGYFEEEDTDDEYALSTGISRIKNDEWSSECIKLENLYYNLSDSDIEIIKGIIKKHI